MLKRYAVAIIVGAALLSACGKQDQNGHYTSVLEGTKTKVNCTLGGSLAELFAAEGDAVQPGDTLAVLDSRELNFQKQQLEGVQDEIAVQEGVLRTQISQAESDLAYARLRKTRAQNLLEQGAVPRQNLDDAANLESKARSQLESAQKNLGQITAKREQSAAQLQTLLKKLDDLILRANAAGKISVLYYHRGEVLPPLGQLLEIVSLDPLETSIYVDEAILPRVKPGQTVSVKIAGLAQPLSGTVIRIADQAEFTPKNVLTPDNRSSMVYAVRIRIANPDGVLKDGMPVDVYLR